MSHLLRIGRLVKTNCSATKWLSGTYCTRSSRAAVTGSADWHRMWTKSPSSQLIVSVLFVENNCNNYTSFEYQTPARMIRVLRVLNTFSVKLSDIAILGWRNGCTGQINDKYPYWYG